MDCLEAAVLRKLANRVFCPPAPRSSLLSTSMIRASTGVSPRALYETSLPLARTAARSRSSTSGHISANFCLETRRLSRRT